MALGRAVVREPEVFLFDEPLSNLDAALRVSTRNELVKLHQRLGATMIYVTHDQVEAMTMGERICIINKGRLVQVGAPLGVYRDPADMFVARFPRQSADEPVPGAVGVGGRRGRCPNRGNPASASGRRCPGAGPLCRRNRGLRHSGPRTCTTAARRPPWPTARICGSGHAFRRSRRWARKHCWCFRSKGSKKAFGPDLGRDCTARVGDTVDVHMDVHRIHLFDPQTTLAIAAGRI